MAQITPNSCIPDNTTLYYTVLLDTAGEYLSVNAHYKAHIAPIISAKGGCSMLQDLQTEDHQVFKEAIQACLSHEEVPQQVLLRMTDAEGDMLPIHWEFSVSTSVSGASIIGCQGFAVRNYYNIIEKHKALISQLSYNQNHVYRKSVANILGVLNLLEFMPLDEHSRSLLHIIQEHTVLLDKDIRAAIDLFHNQGHVSNAIS
jgi:hypothetical protein